MNDSIDNLAFYDRRFYKLPYNKKLYGFKTKLFGMLIEEIRYRKFILDSGIIY